MGTSNIALTLDILPPPPPEKFGWPWTEQTELLTEFMPNGSEWPKISIVTPSYNQGKFIEETIRSVLLQGYPNLEYIIIDGGSTDNSIEIIKRYAPWLDYWVSEKDWGQSDALNKGFALSTGELCAYMNSDDLFFPYALSIIASNYTNNQKNKWFASSVLYGKSIDESKLWQPYAAKFQYFVVNQTIAQPGVFWTSDIQPKPWFDATRHINMDHKFFIEIYIKFGLPYLIPNTTAFFRWHPDSKTSHRSESWNHEYQELINDVMQQVDSRTAFAIQQEAVRLRNTACIGELLSTTPKNLKERWSRVAEAFGILTNTPFIFRDRIFISGLARLCLRLFQIS